MAGAARVLVDTSIWIDFLNGRDEVVTALTGLMLSGRVVVCGQILQEVLQGSRDDKAFARLEHQMAVWPAELEEPADFIEAARIFARQRWKGLTVPPTEPCKKPPGPHD
jgi:predicted nucleic acid-binding protein